MNLVLSRVKNCNGTKGRRFALEIEMTINAISRDVASATNKTSSKKGRHKEPKVQSMLARGSRLRSQRPRAQRYFKGVKPTPQTRCNYSLDGRRADKKRALSPSTKSAIRIWVLRRSLFIRQRVMRFGQNAANSRADAYCAFSSALWFMR